MYYFPLSSLCCLAILGFVTMSEPAHSIIHIPRLAGRFRHTCTTASTIEQRQANRICRKLKTQQRPTTEDVQMAADHDVADDVLPAIVFHSGRPPWHLSPRPRSLHNSTSGLSEPQYQIHLTEAEVPLPAQHHCLILTTFRRVEAVRL